MRLRCKAGHLCVLEGWGTTGERHPKRDDTKRDKGGLHWRGEREVLGARRKWHLGGSGGFWNGRWRGRMTCRQFPITPIFMLMLSTTKEVIVSLKMHFTDNGHEVDWHCCLQFLGLPNLI